MAFRLLLGDNLKSVSTWHQKACANNTGDMPEYAAARAVTTQMRDGGTVQGATRRFSTDRGRDFKLFLIVTRHDADWSGFKATPEPYALAITIQDRENVAGRSYEQIIQQLGQRTNPSPRAGG